MLVCKYTNVVLTKKIITWVEFKFFCQLKKILKEIHNRSSLFDRSFFANKYFPITPSRLNNLSSNLNSTKHHPLFKIWFEAMSSSLIFNSFFFFVILICSVVIFALKI